MGEHGMGRDHLLIYYENDGEDIASYIQNKLSDDRYNCRVTLVDISHGDVRHPTDAKVFVLLLTPEMEQFMQRSESTARFHNLPYSPRSSVVLRHTTDNNSQINDLIASKLKGFKKWTLLELGTTAEDFKKALIQIMQLVDKPPSLKQFSIIPKTLYSSHDDICVIFKKDMHGEVTVWLNDDRIEIKTWRLNPFAYSFKLKNASPGEKQIEIFNDNDYMGTTSLKLFSKMDAIESMLYDVNNPEELLCQVLRVDNIDDLDLEMCDILGNIKEQTGILQGVDGISKSLTVQESKNDIPTLLHFGAKFGLRRFCEKIMECPGSKLALNIRNKNSLTPCLLANLEGYGDLSAYLKAFEGKQPEGDYMEMSNLAAPTTDYENIGSPGKSFREPGRNTFAASEHVPRVKKHVSRSQTMGGRTRYELNRDNGNCSYNTNVMLRPRESATSSLSSDSHDSGVSASASESLQDEQFQQRSKRKNIMTERMTLIWDDMNWKPPPPPRDTPYRKKSIAPLPPRQWPLSDATMESTNL